MEEEHNKARRNVSLSAMSGQPCEGSPEGGVPDTRLLAQALSRTSIDIPEYPDKVIGQTLRYMGWVGENLCHNKQTVKGMIICLDSNPRLAYALKMTHNIAVKYYRVNFDLSDTPFDLEING